MNKYSKHLTAVILVAIFTIPVAVYAKRVDPEKARWVAQHFAETKHGQSTKGHIRLKHTAVKPVQRNAVGLGGTLKKSMASPKDDTLYYVFSLSESAIGGFVIVAADDVAKPILGYSEGGNYNDTDRPPNFVYWMDYLSRQIAFANEHGLAQSEDTKQAWAGTSFTPMRIVGDTLKTKWGQDAPYNNYVPNKYPTGCVATAMAQIMKKYNHPTQGSGSKNGIDFNINYDWKNMNDVYSGATNDVQKNAVATLMRHAGASVDMEYGLGGSSASVFGAVSALSTYFGYGNAIKLIERKSYNKETEWHTEIRKQLDDNRPVLYRGAKLWDLTSGGIIGHVFVCDAYDRESNYFHFNWGWGGVCDGWYLTTALDPDVAVGTYNDEQNAIINIKPGLVDNSYSLMGEFRASKTGGPYAKEIGDVGLTILYPNDRFYVGAIGSGKEPEYIVVWNTSATNDFPGGRFGAALVDEKNNIVEIVGTSWMPIGSIDALVTEREATRASGDCIYYSAECRLPANVTPGKYKIKAAYLPFDGRGDDEWELMNGSWGGKTSTSIEVTVMQPDITSKFVDPNFRKAVYDLIGKPNDGLIYGQDVENITSLNVSSMGIKDLRGIEYFTALKSLNCSDNLLTSLDVSKNIVLQSLDCSNNQLKSINLSNGLTTKGNSSGSFVVTMPKRTPLIELNCSNNNLKMLDVSATSLERLDCRYNFMLDTTWVKGFYERGSLAFNPQKTDITNQFVDNNFRAEVYAWINKDASERILVSDVATIYNLDVSFSNIKSLAGIEHFVGLGRLVCTNNELTELDLSNNVELTLLWCQNNKLKNLNVSKNVILKELSCHHNELTEMDVSNNADLVRLFCSNNKITGELDVSLNTNLSEFNCSDNELQSLKLPMQTMMLQIGWIKCSNNQLTRLDLSGYRDVYRLYCDNNYLTKLILPRGIIYELDCSNNNLDSLFISSLTTETIENMNVQNNYLTSESAILGFAGVWDDCDFVFEPQKTMEVAEITKTIENYERSAYLVTFVNDSGEKIGMQLVQNGKSALPPKLTKEGYVLAWDKDYSNVISDMTLIAQWVEMVAVQTSDRLIPNVKSETNATIATPVTALYGEITLGPNPVVKSAGDVDIFRQGKRISDCELRIYDASGNFINKLKIRDKTHSNLSRRQVGSWDLKDAKGRVIPEGTYAVKGVVKTEDGKKEMALIILGVL